jgi:hypothetical protein
MIAQAQCEAQGHGRMPVKAQEKSLKLAATIWPGAATHGVIAGPNQSPGKNPVMAMIEKTPPARCSSSPSRNSMGECAKPVTDGKERRHD